MLMENIIFVQNIIVVLFIVYRSQKIKTEETDKNIQRIININYCKYYKFYEVNKKIDKN